MPGRLDDDEGPRGHDGLGTLCGERQEDREQKERDQDCGPCGARIFCGDRAMQGIQDEALDHREHQDGDGAGVCRVRRVSFLLGHNPGRPKETLPSRKIRTA